jgi:hypothetical protein
MYVDMVLRTTNHLTGRNRQIGEKCKVRSFIICIYRNILL